MLVFFFRLIIDSSFKLLHAEIVGYSHFAYSRFDYSHFAYSHFAYSRFAYSQILPHSRFAYTSVFCHTLLPVFMELW